MAEQKVIFERTVDYVIDYARRLPNLIGSESIVRFDDNPLRQMEDLRALGELHLLDTISAQVTYSKGDETVAIRAVNGRLSTGSRVFGIASSGEFGNTIISLMKPETHAKASWSHWEALHGKRVAVFHYSVGVGGSQYVVSFLCEGSKTQSVKVAYDGLLSIEAKTGTIVRITRRAMGIPAAFPTRRAATAVDYGPVSIGANSYMLPIRSVTESDNPAGCDAYSINVRLHSLNETRFSNYRLFHAESKLVAADEPPKTQKQPDSPAPKQSASIPAPANSVPEFPQPTPATTFEQPAANQPMFFLPQPAPFREAEKTDVSRDNTSATPATFRERVSIVTVPVVVRDRDGRPVSGLTKDDFELSDNGKRQVIADFTEQRAPARGSLAGSTKQPNSSDDKTPPNRYVAYMFDDLHLTSGDLVQTRSAAVRVLAESLDAGSRLAVLTTSGKVSLGFTNDRSQIVAALNRLRPVPISYGDCPEVSYYMADRIVNANDTEALAEKAKTAIAKCGIDPRAAMAVALSAARRSLQLHDYETRVTLDAIRGIALGMSVLPGERSMLFLSPGFYISAGLPGMQEVIDRAARSGMVIQVLDARGLYAPAGFDAADGEPPDPKLTKLRLQQTEQSVNSEVLAQLAEATGGTLFQNSNDYDAGLRRLSDRPGVLYLLGFSPVDERANGAYHRLRVNIKGHKGLNVQARRGYIAHRANLDAAKEAKEEMENALWSREEMRDIPMMVKSAALEAVGGSQKLNLLLHVDAKQVHFQRRDGRNRDKLTLTFGFFNSDGGMVTVQGEELPLDFSDSDLQAYLDRGVNIRSDLDVKPGSRFLRVVLRDTEGQMSTMNEVIGQ
jgi:VWFA-related protein